MASHTDTPSHPGSPKVRIWDTFHTKVPMLGSGDNFEFWKMHRKPPIHILARHMESLLASLHYGRGAHLRSTMLLIILVIIESHILDSVRQIQVWSGNSSLKRFGPGTCIWHLVLLSSISSDSRFLGELHSCSTAPPGGSGQGCSR